MKPRDFYKILEDFVKEDAYWRALKVGDIIYDEQPRGFDNDYHEMRIDSIDIEEREVVAHDTANPLHTATLSYFLTQEEFDKL